jgi:hypothetical protein
MDPSTRKRKKARPSSSALPADPRVLGAVSFREARVQLESSVQHVIELRRRRRAQARKPRP